MDRPPFTTNVGVGTSYSTGPEQLSIQTDMSQATQYLANDMPELYHDPASPPSAESNSTMSTPLYDWYPLPEGSPYIMTSTLSHDYPFEQSPLSAPDEYHAYIEHLSRSWKSQQFQPSQPSSYSSTMTPNLDWMDELNWEKQRDPPELTPKSNLHYSQARDDHCQSSRLSHSLPASYTATSQPNTHHNTHVSSTASSAASSSALHPPTVSPTMLMLPSTSSTSVPPPAISQQGSPLKLHQPRPSRRIPIISLDALASASDEVLKQKAAPAHQKRFVSISPLSFDCQGFMAPSSPPEVQAQLARYNQAPYAPSASMDPIFSMTSHTGRSVVACTCGCRSTYAV